MPSRHFLDKRFGVNRPVRDPRWFYPVATATLLVLTVIGFQFFYFGGKAYPGRELPPPIRGLIILHGVVMSAWMLVAVLQPVLVATGKKRIHRKVGAGAMVLAIGLIVIGLIVSIESARITPPDFSRFGLLPGQFLVVPLWSIVAFGIFVAIGVSRRNRPEIHRPMMFLASLSVVAAALGRFGMLNVYFQGTVLEQLLSAFVLTIIVGLLVLLVKWALTRSLDRWFALGLTGFTLGCVIATVGSRTQDWERVATALLDG